MSDLDPEPAIPAWLRVARIVRPHGVRGEVAAELLTDFPDRFARDPSVSLCPPAGPVPTRTVAIEQFRLHSGRILFKFAGCDSMEEAQALRDFEVVIPWEARSPLADDEVYIAELVGCLLIDTATNTPVGPVTGVDRESGATELLVVAAEAGELLVPFVKAYDPHWDLAARTLHMRLPGGLETLPEAAAVSTKAGSTKAGSPKTKSTKIKSPPPKKNR